MSNEDADMAETNEVDENGPDGPSTAMENFIRDTQPDIGLLQNFFRKMETHDLINQDLQSMQVDLYAGFNTVQRLSQANFQLYQKLRAFEQQQHAERERSQERRDYIAQLEDQLQTVKNKHQTLPEGNDSTQLQSSDQALATGVQGRNVERVPSQSPTASDFVEAEERRRRESSDDSQALYKGLSPRSQQLERTNTVAETTGFSFGLYDPNRSGLSPTPSQRRLNREAGPFPAAALRMTGPTVSAASR